ncbi:MAG: tetratricopeptide repeat protein [Candidatus Omnitrophota bacterium]
MEKTNDIGKKIPILIELGKLYTQTARYDFALKYSIEAAQLYEKTGNRIALGQTYQQIGEIYEEQRQWEAALKNYQKALEWDEKTGNYFEMGGTYHQAGRIYEARDDIASAFSTYNNGLRISIQAGNQDAADFNLRSLARIFPKLSPEQIETLEKEFGKETVQKLKGSISQ